jgi:hypothetical protein
MNTPNTFPRTFIAALIVITCLPCGKLSAQVEYGSGSVTPIQMVVNGGTDTERWETSHFGNLGLIGLRPGGQAPITLVVSGSTVGYPVSIAPLDGGEIAAAANLSVTSDRTVAFDFRGGTTPGLYRVLVTIGSQQYYLQFYVVKQPDSVICP